MVKIEKKKMSIKKKIIISLITILVLGIIVIILLYIFKSDFRNWIDANILNKNITDEDVSEVSLDTDKSNYVYVYSKYVAVLTEKNITLYNKYGEELTTIDININNGIFDANGKYLAIAENGGTEICLILDKTYLWSNSLEGEILQIHVNANGYVAVITSDSSHQAILTFYNSSGKELFKSYFASTRIVDLSISKDNNFIAVGEVDTSGTLIKSNIKIISVENAQNDTENAIVYTYYSADNDDLITSVKYQNSGQIACMYDNSVDIIKDEESLELFSIEGNITFTSVDFTNYVSYIEEEDSGIFSASSNIKMINSLTGQENIYTLEDVIKEIYVGDNVLAVNVGTELYFFDTNAWLIKKYTGSQEITNVTLSSNLAAIVYNDKVIIIRL